MNILEAEDMVKGLPDQVLFQYAQNPPPQIPQYLAVSEVQRRQDMRQRFQAQQGEQQTIKDQILQGGIASAGGPPPGEAPPGGPPPMAPPGGAPPMGEGQSPVMAAAGGMMPYTMGNGGSVPAGQPDPQVFKEFMKRNFGTRQGLASNIGLIGGAMLGGPVGAGIGGNLGTYIGQKISPAPPPLTDMAMQRILGGGMRAPERTDEEGAPPEPPPFVDETEGMAVGGMVPSRISDAIGSALTPAPSESQSSLPSIGPSRDTVLRKIKALMAQGREMDALVLLRQYGISPSEVMMATGGMTPGGIVYMSQGGTAPSEKDIQRILKKSPYQRTAEENELLRASGIELRRSTIPKEGLILPGTEFIKRFVDPAGFTGFTGQIYTPPAAPPAAPAAPAAAPAAAPGSVDFMTAQQRSQSFNMPPPAAIVPPQAEPQAAPPAPPAANVSPGGIGDLAPRQPAGGGIPPYLANLLKPRERSPEVQAAIDLNRQMAEQGLPAPIDLTQYIQSAQQRQKDAQTEARSMAIANTLMGLGTGLLAGDPAAGLQSATRMATETLREGRREAREEGRSAEALQLQAAQQQRQAILDAMKFKSESVNAIASLVSGEEKADSTTQLQAAQLVVMFQNNRDKMASDLQIAGMNRKDAERKATSEALNRATELVIESYKGRVGIDKLDPAKMADEVRAVQQQLLNSLDSSSSAALSRVDQEALNWANSNPNDPRSSQIKARLGVP